MLIYAGTKSDFMIDTENDCLETKLYENIKLKMNRTTGLSELNAWRNSLKEMYITLNDSDIPKDAGVAIEYNIPQTSKRVDFLISGQKWKQLCLKRIASEIEQEFSQVIVGTG